jgi:hypothetical protein
MIILQTSTRLAVMVLLALANIPASAGTIPICSLPVVHTGITLQNDTTIEYLRAAINITKSNIKNRQQQLP